jgi:death on curing protein
MDVRFLSLTEVLRIHRSSIDLYGGDPAVRAIGLLQFAIAQPRASFGGQYLHDDLPAMAAAYLYHIVSNHPFVDGNKRTGAGAAFVFLRLNNVKVTAAEDEFTEIVLAVARGQASKEAVTEFFRARTGT